MSKPFLAALILILFSNYCKCQSLDSLVFLIKDIQRGSNDSIRFASNEIFLLKFEKILFEKGSFTRDFDSLKNVSVQSPEDKKFRIYSWVVPNYNGDNYYYYGFIQIHFENSDTLIRLIDSTVVIQKPESDKLTSGRWFGAVYYNIIPIRKSGKTYYTLLGWKGKDQRQTQKVIEVLYFNGNKVKFGFPLIKTGSIFRNRMVFTFNAQASMILRFDKKYNGIVFDHLSSNINNSEMLNGPDGTYDALKNKKGKWILFKDVEVGTKWEPSYDLPIPPERK